jgi:hypothetical protein
MEAKEVVFVLMILVGVAFLVLVVSLILSNDFSQENGLVLKVDSARISYPHASGNHILVADNVPARTYCKS